MSPNTEPRAPAHKPQPDASEPRTPGTDMQPEDAGTPASGNSVNSVNSGRGTAAEPATKQTSKTQHESGSRREKQ
jgi:hypothetical protein